MLNPLEVRFGIFDAFRLCAAVNDFIQCADIFVRPLFGGLICRTHFTLFPFGLCRGRLFAVGGFALEATRPRLADCFAPRGTYIYIYSVKRAKTQPFATIFNNYKKVLDNKAFFFVIICAMQQIKRLYQEIVKNLKIFGFLPDLTEYIYIERRIIHDT